MDAIAWVVATAALIAVVVVVALAPRIGRAERARRISGGGMGAGMGGVGTGFDAVWRPSAEEAHAEWRAQIEVPAPAPTPGDKGRTSGRIEGGRITIEPPGRGD